jgi:hypothetical protein
VLIRVSVYMPMMTVLRAVFPSHVALVELSIILLVHRRPPQPQHMLCFLSTGPGLLHHLSFVTSAVPPLLLTTIGTTPPTMMRTPEP